MEFANNPKALENDTANLVLPAHKNLAARLEQLEKTVEDLKDRGAGGPRDHRGL